MVAYITVEQRVCAIGSGMFGWPEVADDVNVHSPKPIAVPGAEAGNAMTATQFGRKFRVHRVFR